MAELGTYPSCSTVLSALHEGLTGPCTIGPQWTCFDATFGVEGEIAKKAVVQNFLDRLNANGES